MMAQKRECEVTETWQSKYYSIVYLFNDAYIFNFMESTALIKQLDVGAAVGATNGLSKNESQQRNTNH